jgi:hypothetical protein
VYVATRAFSANRRPQGGFASGGAG